MKWKRWEWLWFLWVGFAAQGAVSRTAALPVLVAFSALFAAVTVWCGRNLRERLAGIFAAILTVAAGWLALLLLSADLALLVILAVSAASSAALIGWQKRFAPVVSKS